MKKLMLMHVLKSTAVAGLLAWGGVSAQAQGHGGHGGMDGPAMMGGHIEHMLESVDATDAQRAQIKQIMQAARVDLKGQMDAGRQLQDQALTLFSAVNIDAVAIEALRQQTQAQREVVNKRMSLAMIDAARVLTPEQRAKFAEKMKKRLARMAEHLQERAGQRGN